MVGWIGTVARAWTWFWAAEELPPCPPDESVTPGNPERPRAVATRSGFFSAEDLPFDPVDTTAPDNPDRPRAVTVRSVFFSAEDLPFDPVDTSRPKSFFRWLLAGEQLGTTTDHPQPASTKD